DVARADLPRAAVKPRAWFDWRAWFRPMMIAPMAAAVLLCVTLYQSVQVSRLERDLAIATQPRVVPSLFATAVTPGGDPVVDVSERDQFVQLTLDINPTMPVSSYTCEVYDTAGAMRFAVTAARPVNGGTLNLLLPAKGLQPGRYTVRVKPAGETGSTSEPHI